MGENTSDSNMIGDNSVIMMFTSSLVNHAASPHLRLPANFVGVQSVRRDFKKSSSTSASQSIIPNGNNVNTETDKERKSQLKASNDVKFLIMDKNGIERRMTKAEKKAKKFQIAQEKKRNKKETAAKKKRKFEQMTVNGRDSEGSKLHCMASNDVMDQEKIGMQSLSKEEEAVNSSSTYHQLHLNPTAIEQELAEFQGKRGSMPPVILSPPMALQFVSKKRISLTTNMCNHSVQNSSIYDEVYNATLVYDHGLSEEWANRLKQQCVLPAEALRQKEDLRPLAYRLQPEPWKRLRPSLEENQVETTTRNAFDQIQKPQSSLSSSSERSEKGELTEINPQPRDWVPLTCRPRITLMSPPHPLPSTKARIQHDDILSIVFEYIHRETPYFISCGAKFGSDFLIYDGPRDKRHAFAGLRVLSSSTSSMTTTASPSTLVKTSLLKDAQSNKSMSNGDVVELPLPTAYSLTGFVRCLNTAGKLALLATVEELSDTVDMVENEPSEKRFYIEKKVYRVAFVDVALEKVLDVHKRKNRGRSDKKKLQKRRDVTQTLSKI